MQIPGQKLREIRTAAHVPQTAIAEIMRVSVPRVSQMESGRKDPGDESAVRYLQAIEDIVADREGRAPITVVVRTEATIIASRGGKGGELLGYRRADVSIDEFGDLTLAVSTRPKE